MGRPRTSQKSVDHATRVAKAIEFRKKGVWYKDFYLELGWNSIAACQKAVGEALEKVVLDAGEDFKKLMFWRYEEAIFAIWDKVEAGNLKAIDRFDRLSRSQMELTNLKAPIKHEHTGEGGEPIKVYMGFDPDKV